jgi:hypothetical protein
MTLSEEVAERLEEVNSVSLEDHSSRSRTVTNREEPEDRDVRWYATGDGHQYVAEFPSRDGRERPVYLHRLAAVAWGVIDSLADPREVHHNVPAEWREERDPGRSGIPWLDMEEVLEAVDPAEHSRHHFGHGRNR